jgi:hypothetical protein
MSDRDCDPSVVTVHIGAVICMCARQQQGKRLRATVALSCHADISVSKCMRRGPTCSASDMTTLPHSEQQQQQRAQASAASASACLSLSRTHTHSHTTHNKATRALNSYCVHSVRSLSLSPQRASYPLSLFICRFQFSSTSLTRFVENTCNIFISK